MNNLEYKNLVNRLVINRCMTNQFSDRKFLKILLTPLMIKLPITLFFTFARIYNSSLFRRIRRRSNTVIPEIVVLSLSKDQLCLREPRSNLIDFFRENRFENPSGQILIESKLFPRPSFNRRSIVSSAPFHLFLNSLSNRQREEVLKLFRIGLEAVNEKTTPREMQNLRTLYSLFELSFWTILREERITLVTTQSTLKQLPIPFCLPDNQFIRKMMWYSTNSKPIQKQGITTMEPIFDRDIEDFIDMHYVWDSDAMAHLKFNGITRVKAVGSILFTKNRKVKLRREGFTIAYFDITPLDLPNSYYKVERMCQNLSQLVEISNQFSEKTGTKIDLLVKHKRVYTKAHSRRYIELVKRMSKNDELRIIKPTLNLYGLVREVDCVIGSPFTSPVVLAKELGVPAAFMDFYRDEYFLPEVENNLPVLQNAEELFEWLSKVLDSNSV